MAMPKIAISYRRSDSTVIAGRILDRLAVNYGPDSVFMDVHSIPYGTDFRDYIQKALAGIDVLLVVIGPHWLGQQGSDETRISDGEDLVRLEVETALKRGVLVIPVLTSGAAMPAAARLPPSLKPLADRNAAIVDGGKDFHPHMEELIRAIDEKFPSASGKTVVGASTRYVVAGEAVRSNAIPSVSWASIGRDIFISSVCTLLAHYIIVVAFDLNTLYLRFISVVVPLLCAGFLYRNVRPNVTIAIIASLSTALITITCMAIVLGLSFGQSILPATRYEWREAIEYLVSIAASFLVGYLVAPSIGRLMGRRSRTAGVD